MLPYLFLLAVPSVFVFMVNSKRNVNISLFFMAVLYVLFIGFRFQTGSDWPAYAQMYKHIGQISFYESVFYTEPGYAALNWLMNKVGLGLIGVNIFVSVIFIFGLVKFAKITPNPFIALVSVTPYLIIVIGMSATRQAAAIGLVFLIFANWKQSNVRKITLSIMAISFHYSAVIVLFFVLYSLKIPSWLKWLIIIFGGIVSFYVLKETSKFTEYNQTYMVTNIVSPGAIQHALLNGLPAIIYLFFLKKWDAVYEKIDLMRVLSIASIVSVFAVFISSTAIDRLALYLSPIQMMVYSTIPIIFRSYIYSFFIILVHFIILLLWLIYSNTAFVFIPYKNYLFIE